MTTTTIRLGQIRDDLYTKSEVDALLADLPGGGDRSLDDLTDVSAASPSNGQALVWDSALSVWRPGTVEGGSGGGGEVTLAFDFVPEFPNAIIVPASVNNGVLLPDDDSSARISSYRWLTLASTVQTVDIVLRWRLSPLFSSMVGPLKVFSRVSDVFGDCGVEIVELLDTAGVAAVPPSIRRNDGWREDSFALGAGTWAQTSPPATHRCDESTAAPPQRPPCPRARQSPLRSRQRHRR
ncbi:MAG: hypothetical protein R6W76_09475, partial [Caldilinea sp.]